MTKRIPKRQKTSLFRLFRKSEDGAIAVELALIAPILIMAGIGAVDFGLMLNHDMQMKNAIRSGLHYASVRKPSPVFSDPDADGNVTITEIDVANIKSAVEASGPTAQADANRKVIATMFCRCGETDPTEYVDCYDYDSGADAVCSDGDSQRAFLRVEFTETYRTMLNYPGLQDSFRLGGKQEIRLN